MPAHTFHSPSYGQLAEPAVIEKIQSFIAAKGERDYRLIIGSDSLPAANHQGVCSIVTAIVLHRIGNGGIYFWQRSVQRGVHSLRERMYAEALRSISMAQRLEQHVELRDLVKKNLEIHVDVGEYGPTREMIQEIVGMIVGYGYAAKTKPDSFAASKVADRHTVTMPQLAFQLATVRE